MVAGGPRLSSVQELLFCKRGLLHSVHGPNDSCCLHVSPGAEQLIYRRAGMVDSGMHALHSAPKYHLQEHEVIQLQQACYGRCEQ